MNLLRHPTVCDDMLYSETACETGGTRGRGRVLGSKRGQESVMRQ